MKQNSNLDFNNASRPVNLPTPTSAGDGVPKSYVGVGKFTGLDALLKSRLLFCFMRHKPFQIQEKSLVLLKLYLDRYQ